MKLDPKNVKDRDKIIFGSYNKKTYSGGIRRFDGITKDQLKLLLDKKFINPDEKQNACPSVSQIYEFMTKYPDYQAHGYAVSPEREDYRVSLEGVMKNGPSESKEEMHDFTKLFRNADEFQMNDKMYCWFD